MATLADRIEQILAEKRLTSSGREWSRRAGLAGTTVNTFLSRTQAYRAGQRGPKMKKPPDLGAQTVAALARTISVSVEWLLGADTPPLEERWTDLKEWAAKEPIKDVVDAHPNELTVGDLLRYRGAKSSQGARDPDEVWSYMQSLRGGGVDLDGARSVTEEEEDAQIRPVRRRRSRPAQ